MGAAGGGVAACCWKRTPRLQWPESAAPREESYASHSRTLFRKGVIAMDVSGISEAVSGLFDHRNQSGVRVAVEPAEFIKIISRANAPLVIMEETGVIKEKYLYLTIYRGVPIIAKSERKLALPEDADTIEASEIDGLD